MPAPKSAEALSTTTPAKPSKVDAFIAFELGRIRSQENDPNVNPDNIPDFILRRVDKYAQEMFSRVRNHDEVYPNYMTEEMSLNEAARVLAALCRALGESWEERAKDPQWEERVRTLNWSKNVAKYSKAGRYGF